MSPYLPGKIIVYSLLLIAFSDLAPLGLDQIIKSLRASLRELELIAEMTRSFTLRST
ncbi:hypothetical protein PGTUg99_012572 [Puccinia graminis f. sp. tritici]|uniref:Uncharacterized protein n=1 Tax=Puccinia graminis f. sp. tritici TaxID=56615 RepID=A0A5B0RCM9_PUCGR|nr:hypothetical protein PGTUg99_012572 [Puccinia graminis f. sp. tritici]